jgi:signal transduction histidine kinase
MRFLYRLAYTGVHFAKYPIQQRSILLSNVISVVIFCLGVLLFFLYRSWYGWSMVTIAIPVIGLLGLASLYFNSIDLSVISRIWLCLLLPVCILALSIYSKQKYYDQPEELDYYTFRFVILSSCVFPSIFFSFRERFFLIAMTVLILVILLLHDPLHTYFGVGYRAVALKQSSYSFSNVVIFISFFILTGAVLFLKWASEKNEERADQLIEELNTINEELVEKNAEIEAQSQEIQAQAESLHNSQEKLRSAYQTIAAQNENLSSELIARNKDLTETNSELIKHNNELRQFSYTVSHNLRGPVASLLGLLGLIDQQSLETHNAEIFSHIRLSTDRLDGIIKDLGKIIDIRHDIFQIRQKINLEKEINDIKDILRKEISTHRVSFELDLRELPTIYSVKPMVHSILYNIISNAIKYRSPERAPILRIKATQDKDHYILSMWDNGLGIDLSRNKENIFKLYKRFHYHTEGKGIGLYLVKLQAEALGGSIAIFSEVNRYTEFVIKLHRPENIERQVLYHQPHAEIFFDAKINCIETIWNGPITSEQYRSVFKKCLEFVKVYNTPNYLVDLSRQGHIEKADQEWMFTQILPEAAENGLRRIAAIQPNAMDDHIQGYLKGIQQSALKLNIIQRYFTSCEAAMDWIQEENERKSLS